MKQFNNSQTLWLKVPLCMLLGTNTLRCTNALLRFFIELKYFLIFILNSFFNLFTSNKDTIWYLQLFCLFLKLEFHHNYCCNTFMCLCLHCRFSLPQHASTKTIQIIGKKMRKSGNGSWTKKKLIEKNIREFFFLKFSSEKIAFNFLI